MATRTIIGVIYHPGGVTPWPNAEVSFRLTGCFAIAGYTYPEETHTVITNATGAFTVNIAVPNTGTAQYQVLLPDGFNFYVNLAAGAAITLEDLIAIIANPTASQNTLQTLIDAHAGIAATTAISAHVELATTTEAQAGTDTARAVTPAGLPLFKPNGTALQADLAGNARGAKAIDLCQERVSDDFVVSGSKSFGIGSNIKVTGNCSFGGGDLNLVEADYSLAFGYANQVLVGANNSVAIGTMNICQDNPSAIAIGQNNTASGNNSVAMGDGNLASAQDTVAIGLSCQATAPYSIAIGDDCRADKDHSISLGLGTKPSNKYQKSFGSDLFSQYGDCQMSDSVLNKSVVHNNNNWYELFLDGSLERLIIPVDTVWTFVAKIVGTTQGCTKSFGFKIEGIIENDGGTTTLLASMVIMLYDADDVSFDARARGDDTNDALVIEVQDADGAGNTVRWVASIQTVEVTFPA
jgi:autotransporter adhesin